MVYKTCLSQFDSHMHEAQVRRGDLPGAYLHSTATTPFKTVCKQFINGSVPFGYSLNSGFDTGNDSWFSSGAWQVGTPVQKNACMYRCSVGGREQGTQRSELPLPVGSSSQRRRRRGKKKIPLRLSKKREPSGATVLLLQTFSLDMHT